MLGLFRAENGLVARCVVTLVNAADSSGEVSRGDKMTLTGTGPESYITEYTLVYEDQNLPNPRNGIDLPSVSTLETTQGQIDGLFSQLPSKYTTSRRLHLWEIFCPWVASRVV